MEVGEGAVVAVEGTEAMVVGEGAVAMAGTVEAVMEAVEEAMVVVEAEDTVERKD